MRLLTLILCLFVFSCDDDSPTAPSLDLCGVEGGNDINEDGYHCGDLNVVSSWLNLSYIELFDFFDTWQEPYGHPMNKSTWQWLTIDGEKRLTKIKIRNYNRQNIGFPGSDCSSDSDCLDGNICHNTYYFNEMVCSEHVLSLDNIPNNIDDLVYLESLKLFSFSQISELPDEIYNLQHLNSFHCELCGFTNTNDFCNFNGNLTNLFLDGNLIQESVPECLCDAFSSVSTSPTCTMFIDADLNGQFDNCFNLQSTFFNNCPICTCP